MENETITARFLLGFLVLLLSLLPGPGFGQNTQQGAWVVTGRVTSEDGQEGLPGVNVTIEGTTTGTITNIEGEYTIRVPGPGSVLVFSFVGYRTSSATVRDQTTINIVLEQETEELEEVVVVGYGTQKKETVTGSIVSVETEQLIQSPSANISNRLAGRMPGLIALQNSGVPGEDMATLRIRGIGTLNPGDEAAPLILVDGVEQNSIDQIDPNEIESLNILKDASATAVYGVRGANGVILVTTKSGKVGRPRISVSSNLAVNVPTNIPDWLDPYNFSILWNEALENDGFSKFFRDEEIEKFRTGSDPIFYPWVNQYEDFINNPALQQQYNVNLTGGTETVKYFISAGLFDQAATYQLPELEQDIGFDPKPSYMRYNLRSNFDFQITSDLLARVRMGGSFENKHNANTGGHNHPDPNVNLLDSWTAHPPMTGIGVYDGKLITGYRNDPLQRGDIRRGYSIYEKIFSGGYRERDVNNFTLNLELNYDLGDITPGLKARARTAYTHYYLYEVRRSKGVDSYSFVYNPEGEHFLIQTGYDSDFGFDDRYDMFRRYYTEAGIEYDRKFGDHEVTGLVLYNQSKEHDPGLQYNVPRAYMGLVGRVTYNYSYRYMAEFNAGYNGSENFAKGNRFGFFPAFSLGWVLTEESFFPENRVLTYLKVRGSYGEVGNDKLGGDRFLYLPPVYHFPATNWLDNGYYFGREGENLRHFEGAEEGAVGNPDITWEVAKKTNLGFDARFFTKLSVQVDLFRENRDNILWQVAVTPGIVGSDLVPGNIGEVDNKGLEVAADWNDQAGQFTYFLSANYSFARNKVVYKAEPKHKYDWLDETGFSLGLEKVYKNEGFYNYPEETVNRPYYNFGGNAIQRGDLISVDINGDGIIDPDDLVPAGFPEFPEMFFGLSGGLTFKGFDFSFLFQGASNFYTQLSGKSAWAFSNGMQGTLSRHLQRWNVDRFEEGLPITEPRVMTDGGSGVNIKENEFYLRDRKYVRLKNLEIGYTISSPGIRRTGIEDLRVYANGLNLFTWSKYEYMDPETPKVTIYPVMRTVNLGLTVSF